MIFSLVIGGVSNANVIEWTNKCKGVKIAQATEARFLVGPLAPST